MGARIALAPARDPARSEERGAVRETLRRLARNRAALVGGVVLLLMILIALASPYVAPYDPIEVAPEHALEPPGAAFLMGTDEFGRDIFSRVIVGSRISLRVGLISTSISVAFGISLGLLAGYRGGRIAMVIMRAVDVMLAVPGILLALVIVAGLGSSIFNVMIAVGIAGIPRFTRLVRGCVLSAKENAP